MSNVQGKYDVSLSLSLTHCFCQPPNKLSKVENYELFTELNDDFDDADATMHADS